MYQQLKKHKWHQLWLTLATHTCSLVPRLPRARKKATKAGVKAQEQDYARYGQPWNVATQEHGSWSLDSLFTFGLPGAVVLSIGVAEGEGVAVREAGQGGACPVHIVSSLKEKEKLNYAMQTHNKW